MSSKTTTPFFPGWLFLLAMLTALSPLSVDLYLPAFPAIGRSLDIKSADVQITLAIFLLGMSFGQLLYGPLSDRYGRKPPLYFGLLIYIVASIICMLAEDLITLTTSRFFQALGGSAGVVICRAVIRDRTTTSQAAWAFSMLMLALGLAPILAPILGGLLLMAVGWRGIFAVLAGAGLVLLLSVHFCMDETISRHTSQRLGFLGTFRRYGSLARNAQFMTYVFIGSLPFGGMFAYVAGSPYVIIELYEVPAEHFGWFFGINAFGMIAGSQFNARLVGRFGPAIMLKHVIRVSVLATLTGLVFTLLGLATLHLLMLCFFVYMTSMGMLTPNAVALAMANEGHRAGAASAIMGCIQFLMGTCGAAAVSIWTVPSAIPLLLVMLLLSSGSLLLHSLSNRQRPLISKSSDI